MTSSAALRHENPRLQQESRLFSFSTSAATAATPLRYGVTRFRLPEGLIAESIARLIVTGRLSPGLGFSPTVYLVSDQSDLGLEGELCMCEERLVIDTRGIHRLKTLDDYFDRLVFYGQQAIVVIDDFDTFTTRDGIVTFQAMNEYALQRHLPVLAIE